MRGITEGVKRKVGAIMDTEQILKITSPILTTIIGAIVKHFTEARSKIISYLGHVSAFTLNNEQKTQVYTHSIIVRNAGRKSAKNIRVGHYVLPPEFNIFPPIQFSIEHNPKGEAEILIPILVPNEQITISYLYFPPLTWANINSYTKSDDGFANIINAIPIPQPSRWVIFAVWVLMFVGASFLIYLIMKLITTLI